MARPRRTSTTRSTGDYRHDQARRKNNPPVGMVAYEAKLAEQAGDAATVEHRRSRLGGFRQIRLGAARSYAAGESLLALLQDYQAALQAADREQPDVVAWRAVADSGERLLAAQAGAEHL